MKRFLLMFAVLVTLSAAKSPLAWTDAVVESSLHQAHYGEVYHEPPMRTGVNTLVRESIYIDAGPWLYHVSQMVTYRGMANLREGDKIEIAVRGKSLILRSRGRQFTTHIEQRSRGAAPVTPPASPR